MSSIRQQERNYNLTATFNFKLHVRTRTTRWKRRWLNGRRMIHNDTNVMQHKKNI